MLFAFVYFALFVLLFASCTSAGHGQLRFTDLLDNLSSPVGCSAPSVQQLADGLQADVASGLPARAKDSDEWQYEVFFRVVKAIPSKQKLVRVAAGAGRRFAGDDVVVAIVGVRTPDNNPDLSTVDSRPMQYNFGGCQLCTLSGLTSSYQEAASDMRIWDCADTVQYGIKSCASHRVSQVVTAMVKACAFADSHNSYWVKSVSDEVEVLRQLRDLGHVSCGQQVGDSVPWVLTRYGARSVLTDKPLLDFVRVAFPARNTCG